MDSGAYKPRRHAPRPVRALVKNPLIDSLLTGGAVEPFSLNLNPAVGRGEVRGFWGTGEAQRRGTVVFHSKTLRTTQPWAAKAVQFAPVADSPKR